MDNHGVSSWGGLILRAFGKGVFGALQGLFHLEVACSAHTVQGFPPRQRFFVVSFEEGNTPLPEDVCLH